MRHIAVMSLMAALLWLPSADAAESIGIFETLLESSQSFAETADAVESAIEDSGFTLHATHTVAVPDDKHQAKLYVLTSPSYIAAAAAESPRTVSAQVLRLAVYTLGDDQKAFVNMANPVAHAMVYYSGSVNYDALVKAATTVADDLRAVIHALPGTAVRRQQEPARTEKKYRKFNGDGPAKMMAKFRNWEESQLSIDEDTAQNFGAVVAQVQSAIGEGDVGDAEEPLGWDVITRIDFGDNAVYFGLTNPYIEDKMVRINSRFRKDGKTDAAPYPGVDHIAALPTDVLVVKDGNKTRVLHYGQMWRMQLYFWDSGYRAFTANVGVPGNIVESIEDTISGSR